MGQSVSSVIRAANGEPCHEKRREAEDVLNTLVAVAEDKARIHQSKVARFPIDGEILPVEKIVGKLHMVHCGVKKDPTSIKQVMKECLRNRVREDTVSLLAEALCIAANTKQIDGLTAVTLQSVERLTNVINGKKSSELISYAVVLGKQGGIGRSS